MLCLTRSQTLELSIRNLKLRSCTAWKGIRSFYSILFYGVCNIMNFRFVECMELYKDLIKNTQDDYEAERETNLSAVIASLSLEGTVS